MAKFLTFTGVMFLLLSGMAHAEIHTYSLPSIAHSEERCLKVENSLVEKFARLADASILSHGCERNPSRTYDLVIEYSKATKVRVVSTYDEFDYVHGLYASADECVAHYKEEMASFKEQTGLEPLLAYCFMDGRPGDQTATWTMRIDGFGDALKSPHHFSQIFLQNIQGDVAAYEVQLKAALEAFGGKNIRVMIRSHNNRASVHAMYYAEKQLPLFLYSEGHFQNLQSCESYRDQMSEIFRKAGGQSALYFCRNMPYISDYAMFSVGLVLEPLASKVSSAKFSSFAACEAKREETEMAWKNGLQKNVVGSVCAMEDTLTMDNFFSMRIFWLD